MLRRSFLTAAAALLATGCAVGHEYDYRGASVAVPASRDGGKVAVAVLDRRPYVLAGEKPPSFIGLQRGGFGNPFDVGTASGQPLARDFEQMLRNAFAGNGREAVALELPAGAGTDEALAAFRRGAADRLLLVEMREWKTDVMIQMTAHWDMTARVYDRTGAMLAEETLAGSEGSGGMSTFESANAATALAFASRRLGELVARPQVAAALG